MKLLTTLFLLILPLALLSQSNPMTPQERSQLAEEVKQEFLHCWNGYKTYAWGHDGLKSVSKSPYDWYSVPLYMTPVDALDTMVLMGLTEEAQKTREFIAKNLTFNHDIYVKNFEITIRLLGGLLSNYQLSGDKRLLSLADDLGTRLLKVFDTPTGMPYVDVNLRTGAVRGTNSNPAEIGTLLIEFGTLSKLTGKPVYFEKAKHALVQLFNRRSELGLVGEWIDVTTGKWTNPNSHVSACIDSYYEYLLKSAILFDDADCRKMWEASIQALNTHVADRTASGLWYGHVDMNTGKRVKTQYGALDAFFPAVLALSGDLDRAKDLQESCYKMWMKEGIEPETFNYAKMEVASPRFFLNPEIMESAYYLYHYTNDPRYLEMGKVFFEGLKKYCRTDAGYTELKSVITKEKGDRMESYFLAETLKYLYLLFAPPETLDFKNTIFNTEAHPIKKTW